MASLLSRMQEIQRDQSDLDTNLHEIDEQTVFPSLETSTISVHYPVQRPHSEQIASPRLTDLRRKIRSRLLAKPDEADGWCRDDPEKAQVIRQRLKSLLDNANITLTPEELATLENGLLDDLLGFGPIDILVRDHACTEIMVNGPDQIFAEFGGKLNLTAIRFDDENHVLWVAQRIVRPLQRTLDRANPMVDARLPDGSRVHIVSQPSAIHGTTITIRKFPEKPLSVADLIRYGSFTDDVGEFLRACVASRLNVIVSGGTGSGKTTLLNVLSSFIPDGERIITIEDAAELQLSQSHIVSLETSPPIPGGDGHSGRFTIRDLVKGALRMRPDRIVVGECRSGEALDMLQAMNTGHDGSLTTIHSNSPRDSLARLETLCLMAGVDLPVSVIRRQIASAVDVIVQQARLRDGARKITQITEIQGMEGDQVTLQDIFVYRLPGQRGPGVAHVGGGKLEPTGFRPKFSSRLEENGFKLTGKMFGAGQVGSK